MENAGRQQRKWTGRPPKALRQTSYLFVGFIIVGIATIASRTSTLGGFAVGLAWALASLAAGATVGLLFGIPKIVQSGVVVGKKQNKNAGPGSSDTDADEEVASGYAQQVNTNLTDISDWLTKIIVGLGLTNLQNIPSYLMRIAAHISNEIDPKPHAAEAFAVALIVGFTIVGFLFGYLSTRLFLAAAFSEADQAWARVFRKQQAKIDETSVAVVALSTRTDVLAQAAAPSESVVEGAANTTAVQKLRELADAYLEIGHPEWGTRVRLKDKAADEMGDFILKSGLSHDSIVAEITRARNEGLVLALATAINLRPEAGDADRLLKVALPLERLHVKYRFVLAISELARRQLLSSVQRRDFISIIDAYRTDADGSLAKLLQTTRTQLVGEPSTRPNARPS
jgi:hypothetical protein